MIRWVALLPPTLPTEVTKSDLPRLLWTTGFVKTPVRGSLWLGTTNLEVEQHNYGYKGHQGVFKPTALTIRPAKRRMSCKRRSRGAIMVGSGMGIHLKLVDIDTWGIVAQTSCSMGFPPTLD